MGMGTLPISSKSIMQEVNTKTLLKKKVKKTENQKIHIGVVVRCVVSMV